MQLETKEQFEHHRSGVRINSNNSHWRKSFFPESNFILSIKRCDSELLDILGEKVDSL